MDIFCQVVSFCLHHLGFRAEYCEVGGAKERMRANHSTRFHSALRLPKQAKKDKGTEYRDI